MSVILELKKIKRYFVRKSNFKKISKNIGDIIINSDYFKNNDLNKCFSERLIPSRDGVIERIIIAYNKAKAAQKNFPEAYQVGNEWLPIYQHYMNGIIDNLSASNKAGANKIYENFMREDCSIGLHGLPTNMQETYFNNKISKLDGDIYLHDALYRYDLWKKLTDNKYSTKDLYMPDYGNPYGYYIDDTFIRTGAEYLHYYAICISELIKDEQERKVVVEIGGGYGGLGYFLSKLMSNLTYVDFDLPENMALTAYYLMNSFPEKKILLYGEAELNEDALKNYDIIIMPNFELSNLPSKKANLAFNSYSLAEMSTETINIYITELKSISKEHIFHVNHTERSHSLKADEFGIDDNEYKLIYKKPALWNLGRDIVMDEGEYLYSKFPLN
jgi:putative sugar O-methyltransferase